MKYIWICADYKQAEAMIVAWAGPVPRLQEWFRKKEDVHLNMAKLIARVVQEQKLKLPTELFVKTPWQELTKQHPERQTAKNTVHANSYGMGAARFGVLTGLPEKIAALIQTIYFRLVPEVRTQYQAWINSELEKHRRIITPLGRLKVFYDTPGPEQQRSAYSTYAQDTVGDMKTQWICDACEIFDSPKHAEVLTPDAIRSCGLDVGMEMHDSLAVRCENNPVTIDYTIKQLIKTGTIPLLIKGDVLEIPIEIKIGPNLKELEEIKV